MTDLNRREAIAAASGATFAATLPSLAFAADAAGAKPTGTGAQWDLTEIYPSDAAWEAARKAALAAVPGFDKYKGKLGESAASLKAALQAISDMNRTVMRIYAYASLKADEDQRVAANQERQGQAVDLFTRLGEATAWMSPEILTVGKDKIETFLAADPGLAKFRFGLMDTLRRAPNTLSAEGEAVLAGTTAPLDAFSEISGQLTNVDIPWPTITLSTGKSVRLDNQGYALNRDAPNRADRKAVFDATWKTYGQYKGSFGSNYAGHLKGDMFSARARKHKSALEAALAGNNVPETVYRTLVKEANAGLPQLHRYFELRRKMLKLPDMHYYDIYPPLVQLGRKFTLADMRTLTLEAVAPLGKDYVRTLSDATAKKWMDPFPRTGKRGGAYMNPAAYDVHPYLLLNLGEDYDGLSTYAHEWGHAMHTLLAQVNQPFETSDYPIFTAEIASTINEQLLCAYMVGRAKTNQEKIFYLGQQLENLRGTFFRQTMFAEFELTAHDQAEAGEGLSGDRFTAIYLDLLKRYHGPKVEIDPVYAAEWSYIPHFFNSFYVYQYATCISAATWFAQGILAGGPKERDNYLAVLKAGGSDYPVDLLKRAGLDMTSPDPYRAIVTLMGKTIDEIEALLA
ncbi:MAG: oligoendopeptidase F [Sphingobium sp.]